MVLTKRSAASGVGDENALQLLSDVLVTWPMPRHYQLIYTLEQDELVASASAVIIIFSSSLLHWTHKDSRVVLEPVYKERGLT